ncbi:hypothetical protein IE81DRAFT_116960 [Ceraceosorus guamensis]|uniref:Uncharacterized protein n=1 Tax=Ceraceosorus guamensis TaxID=1522189 RepID=A0A316VZ97_9BASI|nr:hypothetical protein IE81DRAFT_116960 [Ceraceosorus guamensis]PWN42634.1 hypothetical protein IE81DRAFT_116960 [Ceraceosorus guamensis]
MRVASLLQEPGQGSQKGHRPFDWDPSICNPQSRAPDLATSKGCRNDNTVITSGRYPSSTKEEYKSPLFHCLQRGNAGAQPRRTFRSPPRDTARDSQPALRRNQACELAREMNQTTNQSRTSFGAARLMPKVSQSRSSSSLSASSSGGSHGDGDGEYPIRLAQTVNGRRISLLRLAKRIWLVTLLKAVRYIKRARAARRLKRICRSAGSPPDPEHSERDTKALVRMSNRNSRISASRSTSTSPVLEGHCSDWTIPGKGVTSKHTTRTVLPPLPILHQRSSLPTVTSAVSGSSISKGDRRTLFRVRWQDDVSASKDNRAICSEVPIRPWHSNFRPSVGAPNRPRSARNSPWVSDLQMWGGLEDFEPNEHLRFHTVVSEKPAHLDRRSNDVVTSFADSIGSTTNTAAVISNTGDDPGRFRSDICHSTGFRSPVAHLTLDPRAFDIFSEDSVAIWA